MKTNTTLLSILALAGVMASCNNDDDSAATTEPTLQPVLASHSETPVFLAKKSGFENIEIYSLLSSEDQLIDSPNFVYGSMADGAGLLRITSYNVCYTKLLRSNGVHTDIVVPVKNEVCDWSQKVKFEDVKAKGQHYERNNFV